MTQNQKSPSPSEAEDGREPEVNRTFIAATIMVFEACDTREQLEAVGERLRNDKIATRAEKRILRDHYVKMRNYFDELDRHNVQEALREEIESNRRKNAVATV